MRKDFSRSCRCLVAVVGLLGLGVSAGVVAKEPAGGGQGEKKPAPSSEVSDVRALPVVRRFTKDAEARAFVQMVNGRDEVKLDWAVLTRLVGEKVKEQAVLNSGLQKEFNVDPNLTYQYDAKEKTIYLLSYVEQAGPQGVEKKNGTAADKLGPERKQHRVLKEAKDEQRFLHLLRSRKVVQDEIAAMQMLLKEKQEQYARYASALRKGYGVEDGRKYRYDPARKTVYELTAETRREKIDEQTVSGTGAK